MSSRATNAIIMNDSIIEQQSRYPHQQQHQPTPSTVPTSLLIEIGQQYYQEQRLPGTIKKKEKGKPMS